MLKEVVKEIQSNVVDEMNFEDSSVGIYSVGRIDQTFIEELEMNGDIKVGSHDSINVKFIVDGIYFFHIGLVVHNQNSEYQEAIWEIIQAEIL